MWITIIDYISLIVIIRSVVLFSLTQLTKRSIKCLNVIHMNVPVSLHQKSQGIYRLRPVLQSASRKIPLMFGTPSTLTARRCPSLILNGKPSSQGSRTGSSIFELVISAFCIIGGGVCHDIPAFILIIYESVYHSWIWRDDAKSGI